MNFYDWRLRISFAAAEAHEAAPPASRTYWRLRVLARLQNLGRQLGNAGSRTVAASRRVRRA
jgi:hypothetical protein